jgi:RNA polymerase sigma-70 factor (ECF subfamily)
MEQVLEIMDGSENDRSSEALDEARHLLAGLPAEEQVLLTLVHLNGMSMAEAADHFGWSTGKAKIKAFRARKFLRKTLRNHCYEKS